MNIKNIIISESFAKSSPAKWKLAQCRTYYETNGEFDREIVLNGKNMLVDGYVAYLIAKEKGLSEVPISRCWIHKNLENKTYVFGRHKPHGKRYVWLVPQDIADTNKIKIGSLVAVETKYGTRNVIVNKIKKSKKPPTIFKLRKVLAVE